MTTGQSEPKDNEDAEGPGSEITGHTENEHRDPETETWNRKSKLAQRLETAFCLQAGRCCTQLWLLWSCSECLNGFYR